MLGPETHRTEPGTWREIIGRFEHERSDAPSEEPPTLPAGEAQTGVSPEDEPRSARQPRVVDAVDEQAEAETQDLEPLERWVPWEFEAMTTPDYTPPRSIHDPEHDSWPVEAEDGDAVPAWSDEAGDEGTADGDVFPYDEIGELVLDEVARPDPWDVEPDEISSREREFPLNAFIVPAGVEHAPSGYAERDVARRVAHRLDQLAQQLRDGGLGALARAGSVDELSRVLAAIVTGYVSRDA